MQFNSPNSRVYRGVFDTQAYKGLICKNKFSEGGAINCRARVRWPDKQAARNLSPGTLTPDRPYNMLEIGMILRERTRSLFCSSCFSSSFFLLLSRPHTVFVRSVARICSITRYPVCVKRFERRIFLRSAVKLACFSLLPYIPRAPPRSLCRTASCRFLLSLSSRRYSSSFVHDAHTNAQRMNIREHTYVHTRVHILYKENGRPARRRIEVEIFFSKARRVSFRDRILPTRFLSGL